MKKLILSLTLFLLTLTGMAQPFQTNISYLPNNPCANSPMYFSASTNMNIPPQFMWVQWDFGDGTSASAAGNSISHTYAAQGVYNVTCWISDSLNWDTAYTTVWVGGDCSNMDYVFGTVYHDADNDGVQDPNELGMPNQTVCISNGGNQVYLTTDSLGQYGYYNSTGIDTITVIPPLYWNIGSPVSGNYTITLSGTGTTHPGNDFGLFPTSSINDLVVYMYSMPSVPGFTRRYHISYHNAGTTLRNATLSMNYDANLIYTNHSNIAVHNAGTQTVTWNVGTLMPGQWGYQWVELRADTAFVSVGDTLKHYVQIDPIAGDTTPFNNLDTLCQVVVGSYDPNDKLVDATPEILPGQTLEYTVRFQNTGNYWAQNVYIRDTLDSNLDLSTLRILGTSHAMNYSLGTSDAVTFNFPNIVLPDSGRDEPGSHGFVTYQVKVKNGLADGTHIYNTAHIYFDFNLPIVTNTTDNFIDLGTGIERIYDSFQVQLYPNPMSEFAWLRFENASQASFDFRLMDLSGRVLQEELDFHADWIRIDRNGLAPGVYLYQLSKETGEAVSGKIVVQ